MDFEVIIDTTFVDICKDETLSPIDNKNVVGVINDFEDGLWRYDKFSNFIWDNIAETALSYSERLALVEQSHSLLTAAARNLRLTDKAGDISQGSELAEIVLYAFMKHHYKALPVVPKIFHKQNVQDNAKGADSVHIVIDSSGDFTLWFGEAKFYNSIEDRRLSTVVESVINSLQSEKLRKENSIITNINDLDGLVTDPIVREEIKNALSHKASIDSIKPKINIPILLLHECSITSQSMEVTAQYKSEIIKYHTERATAYFSKQIKMAMPLVHKYNEVRFHIILFPVPSKDKIVGRFVKNVEHYKDC